jgi:predicted lipoprotein with Yx(FWY)xxD motif
MQTRFMAVPMLGLAVLLAACSSGTAATATPPASVAPASAAPSTAAAGGATVDAKTVGNFPNIVIAGQGAKDNLGADKSGFTLYYFTKDTKDSGTSACSDKCYANWPALVVPDGTTPAAGTGVTGTLGTIKRADDGKTQVTLNGLPLYYFAKDTAAGQTNGYYPGWGVVNADGSVVAPPSPPPASPAASTGSTGAALALAKTNLGNILVDGKGMTLYLFTPDTKDKSACTADCLANWPALTSATAPTLGAGLDAEDFGTLTRDDGSKQVTFYGHPLYYFAGDSAAGDVAGQGKFSKWYVIDKEGNAIK